MTRCRCDIQNVVPFFCTRVLHPDDDYWVTLKIIIKYGRGKIYLNLTLEEALLHLIKWWVYYFRNHTGAEMSLGKVVVDSMS